MAFLFEKNYQEAGNIPLNNICCQYAWRHTDEAMAETNT
jgi:hypothetical protein